jgi:hypothetical protein
MSKSEADCVTITGLCELAKTLAADFSAAFFSKHMPPEHWPPLSGFIPDSLLVPPLTFTPKQAGRCLPEYLEGARCATSALGRGD